MCILGRGDAFLHDSSTTKKPELLCSSCDLTFIAEGKGDATVPMDNCFFHHHGPDGRKTNFIGDCLYKRNKFFIDIQMINGKI